MSWPEYRQVDHAAPYILDLRAGGGRLLYFGAQHTYDPADVQVELIERLWRDVSPTIAFNEGGNPPTLENVEEAVRNHGEPGLVRHLAAKAGIKVTSLDPPRSKIAQHLRTRFSPEEVKLYFVLQAVLTHRRNPVEPFEERMVRVFSIFAQTGGWRLRQATSRSSRQLTGDTSRRPDHFWKYPPNGSTRRSPIHFWTKCLARPATSGTDS